MDRDSFPTLVASDAGWPVMRIPFGSRDPIEVEYNEGGNEYEDTIMIRTGGRPVQVIVDGAEAPAVPAHVEEDKS